MISIIIPVYNGKLFIKNILFDLLNQTFKDFEVIFVDDGSEDGTLLFLEKQKDLLCDKLDIIVIAQENRGVSAARNEGIKAAKGEYLCFIDADDGIKKEYLSYMHQTIKEQMCQLVFCGTDNKNCSAGAYELEAVYTTGEELSRFLYGELKSGIWSLMVSAQIVKENSLFFKEDFYYSEDLHMIWRLISFADRIAEIRNQLYVYNIVDGSAMSKFNEKRMDSIALMEDLETFFSANNPDFYLIFKQYGKARMAWSLLWQAVYHKSFKDFHVYLKAYDFNTELKKLLSYKNRRVRWSSKIFVSSHTLYYLMVKIVSKRFRKN